MKLILNISKPDIEQLWKDCLKDCAHGFVPFVVKINPEVKIVCPQCNGSTHPCDGATLDGAKTGIFEPSWCEGKGYILAHLWEDVHGKED